MASPSPKESEDVLSFLKRSKILSESVFSSVPELEIVKKSSSVMISIVPRFSLCFIEFPIRFEIIVSKRSGLASIFTLGFNFLTTVSFLLLIKSSKISSCSRIISLISIFFFIAVLLVLYFRKHQQGFVEF